ncbi:MAG: exodeoxyribonuclease V subunit beta [Pseudomonadota bacterium]
MEKLILDSFPLDGIRLIEASAGTGKTYTISALYLRLLIETELSVNSILVVTFTEAATQELRDRIRSRIHHALLWLEGRSDDTDLPELLGAHKGDTDVIGQLRDALTCMDEAAIFTIHGFCQRTLTESAFESGVLFDTEFITDESLLRQQAARDFWRNHFAGVSSRQAKWLIEQWKNPDALLSDVTVLVDHPQVVLQPEVERETVERLEQQRSSCFDALRELWHKDHAEVTDLLESSKALGRAEATYRKDKLEIALSSLAEVIETALDPYLLPDGFELFTTGKLENSVKKNQVAPSHVLFKKAQHLFDISDKLERYRRAFLLQEAACAIRASIDRNKSQQRVLFFDDLLNKLDRALQGEGRERLIERIRKRYPLAMIDEFQDTDPVQYRIFSTIYRGCPDCGLFMIGDPKQAIYSFRGADIFTYMQARQDTEAQAGHFTLGVNWRSHSNLVGIINRLFKRADSPFIYDEDIAFHEVEPAGDRGSADKKVLTIDGAEVEPLVSWFVPLDAGNKHGGTITKKWAGEYVADGCAGEVAQLLNLGVERRALLGETPLAARDIAILVRNRYEADAIRQALVLAGVNSITISRDSVFATDEARDLSHLLRAVAAPGNAVLLRTALATRLLGWSARRIHDLGQDEDGWEAKAAAFHGYHALWREHGFMQMLYELLRREGVISTLLALPNGERHMTNVMQLAELTQVTSRSYPGIENLLRWLSDERQLAGEGDCSEEQQLRLESDENLVQIVTIHKSKGMQYPLVFLPFIWSSRKTTDKGIIEFHDEHSHRLHADLGSEQRDAHIQLAERERLAEDLRLLYVALTRAQQRCYFSWGKFNGAAESAMAWLLHQSQPAADEPPESNMAELDNAAIRSALLSLNQTRAPDDEDGDGVRLLVTELPERAVGFDERLESTTRPQALEFCGKVEQRWQLTSFSALSGSIRHEYRIEIPDFDPQDAVQAATPQPESGALSRFTFPRGARAGECLHGMLEEIDFTQAESAQLEAVAARKLEQYGFDSKWCAVVCDWMQAILDTPLDPDDALRLRMLAGRQRITEMEFHYPLNQLSADGLNGLLREMRSYRSEQPRLGFNRVDGMMKGFIDLVFEHQGRFYVADYKSNHLGHSFEDYQQAALMQAIGEHRYDLQYLIYTVALHRYLQQRLSGYDYETHFGGVYYLFLRGMDPHHGAERGIYYDRPESALIDRLDGLFAGESPDV